MPHPRRDLGYCFRHDHRHAVTRLRDTLTGLTVGVCRTCFEEYRKLEGFTDVRGRKWEGRSAEGMFGEGVNDE